MSAMLSSLTYLDEQLQVGMDEAVACQGNHRHGQSLQVRRQRDGWGRGSV